MIRREKQLLHLKVMILIFAALRHRLSRSALLSGVRNCGLRTAEPAEPIFFSQKTKKKRFFKTFNYKVAREFKKLQRE